MPKSLNTDLGLIEAQCDIVCREIPFLASKIQRVALTNEDCAKAFCARILLRMDDVYMESKRVNTEVDNFINNYIGDKNVKQK